MQESSPESPGVNASRSASVWAIAGIPGRILGLVAAHFVIGLVAALVAYPYRDAANLRGTLLFGVILSQSSLLGIWGALGSPSWWKRLIGVVLGVSYLGPVLGIGAYNADFVFHVLVVEATAFAAIPLMIARSSGMVLRRCSLASASSVHFQFSIRQLMLLTLVIACLCASATWAEPYLDGRSVFFLVLCVTVLSGVGVLPVWLILGTRQPILCGIGYVATGFVAGYVFGQIAPMNKGGLWAVGGGVEAVSLAVSLFVIRSCGYRVLRLPSPHRISPTA
jgi:hypothetical protein